MRALFILTACCSWPCSVSQQILSVASQVASAAGEMLSVIDKGAAYLNDKINLFKSEAKFPEVFR